ncbi:transposase [Nocardia sp. CA-129566]|uniref:transposase n=1 Tax=Nocardia sp. CA-129566 TaxID=3239976 RepID=UPI003D97B5C7
MFADLFTDVGRRSVPPMIVAVVMVLQRLEGLSDREAVERFTFDARWKDAAGGLDFDYPGFVHTVLVDMRARLATGGGEGAEQCVERVDDRGGTGLKSGGAGLDERGSGTGCRRVGDRGSRSDSAEGGGKCHCGKGFGEQAAHGAVLFMLSIRVCCCHCQGLQA